MHAFSTQHAAPSLAEEQPAPAGERLIAAALAEGGFGVVLLDRTGRIIHANRPAMELAGHEDDLAGLPLGELIHHDDRGWANSELRHVLSGESDGMRREVRLLRGDGREAAGELDVRRTPLRGEGPVAAVALLADAGDRSAREQELRRLADTDPLTELPNRRRFRAELDRHLKWCGRYGAGGALLVIDLDGLKQINDTHGHLAGDRAIITVANLLASRGRSSDLAARIGGDEFAVLLPAARGEQAAVVARELIASLRGQRGSDFGQPLSISIGVAAINEPTDRPTLFERADTALYEVKRAGGDAFAIAGEAEEAGPVPVIHRRLRLGRRRAG